jgi:hypothetical protein
MKCVWFALLAAAVVAGAKASSPLQAWETVAPEAAVGQVPPEWVPALNEVATLHLSPGAPVTLEQAPQVLHATHPQHRVTIAYLLDLLASSRLGAGEISPLFRAPSLQFALQGGPVVSARVAYNCTPFTSEAGHGYTCRQAPDELILQTRQGREVRIANPRLFAWLSGGWRADIPVGPAPDMEKEMALAIAREMDPVAPWRATFFAEYPVEGKGGTEVRRAWVVEAEYPTGNKTRIVIDAQTGERLRVGQLESLQ